ncbi:MAG: hypothetical protein ACKV2Q_27345 [Planctomycetaceae bacterium]
MLRSVSEDDIAEVIQSLVAAAKGGSIPAAKLLLDRVLGPPKAVISARVRAERSVPAEPSPVITAENLGEVKSAIAARIQRLLDAQDR